MEFKYNMKDLKGSIPNLQPECYISQPGEYWNSELVVQPIRIIKESTEFPQVYPYSLDCKTECAISFEEGITSSLVLSFFVKHFDCDINSKYELISSKLPLDGTKLSEGALSYRYDGFDWYDSNIYTFSMLYSMIDEIQVFKNLLITNANDEAVISFSRWFTPPEKLKQVFVMDDIEAQRYYNNQVKMAVTFYDCFIERIEWMMKTAPDFEALCITGP